MEAFLDRLHRRARGQFALQRLAILSRILLALAFLPTALVKVQGLPFTTMSTDTPIGHFFDAMYRTGGYWRFIGASQLVTGALLLIPRTATLGAVLFFPVILNIFVITVALRFTGTPFITGGMLLAALFLLCWDYHRLKAVLFWPAAPAGPLPPVVPVSRMELAGYLLGTAAGLVVLGAIRGQAPTAAVLPALTAGGVAGVVVLWAWVRILRRRAPGAGTAG